MSIRDRLRNFFRYIGAGFIAIGCLLVLLPFILVPLTGALIVHYGGSAINGHEQAGAYFLVSHGTARQVSAAVFQRMRLLEWATIISSLVLLVAALANLINREGRAKFLRRRS